ncbi:MAG: protein kinase, partial [Anaerolineae bacterium]
MSDPLSPGTRIGRFRLEVEVGRGGMGVVYRALDPSLNRPVALKLLAPHLGGDQDALARFHREAALAAGLKHPHIAIVYEFGEHEGRPYIAMEWIEGRTLKELLAAQGPLPLERSLELFDQLAGALDYAHQRGVVHRDLKPANIIVSPDDKATIVDFGLAWLDTAPSITMSGVTLGTPLYMSPEQIQGQPTDGRSDLYSLAVILYEMLAGQAPFENLSTSALFYQQLYAPPPPITEHNPSLPPRIENALTKALSKDPADRFSTAALFESALREPPAPTLSQRVSFPRWLSFIKDGRKLREGWLLHASRRRWAFALVVLLGLGLLATLTLRSFSHHETPLPTNSVQLSSAPTGIPGSTRLTLPTPTSASTADTLASVVHPSADSLWPVITGNPAQCSSIEEEWNALKPDPRWTYNPQTEGGTGLVGGGGLVVLGVGDGIVRALDWATGDVVWETRFGAHVIAPPAIYAAEENMVVLVPTEDGELYGLNLADARLIWRIGAGDLAGPVSGGLGIGYDGAAYATTGGWLHAFDPFAGDAFLSLELGKNESFPRPPTATNVAIFLSGEHNAIYAIDPVVQDIAWVAETLGRPTTPPVVGEAWGFVLVGTDAGWVHAFSMITGKEVWQGEADSAIVGLACDGGRVYATSANGSLHAWSGRNGEEAWRLSMDSAIGVGPITNGRYVIVGTEAGNVRYFETESGQEHTDFMLALGEPIVYPLAPAGGWLFVRT